MSRIARSVKVLDPEETAYAIVEAATRIGDLDRNACNRIADMAEAGLRTLHVSALVEFLREYNAITGLLLDSDLENILRCVGLSR